MLPPRHRLRSGADFAAVIRAPGAARSGTRLVVVHANWADARAGYPPRVGFVVAKSVGTAVVRNRTKRRLRAIMVRRVTGIPSGVDVVVRANPVAAQSTFAELAADVGVGLARVLGRLGTPPMRRAMS